MTAKHWLDPTVEVQGPTGVLLPMRRALFFEGTTPIDDPTNDRTVIPTFADLAVVETENATPVYVVLATLAVGAVLELDVLVKIASADGAVRQSFKLSALLYGAAGPVATLDGGSLTDATPRGTGAAVAELDLSGAAVRLKVTGVAATDLVTSYDVSRV